VFTPHQVRGRLFPDHALAAYDDSGTLLCKKMRPRDLMMRPWKFTATRGNVSRADQFDPCSCARVGGQARLSPTD
jgi:hypothetical protein